MDEILSIETAISTPYKLCDVRPAYGLIFKEYIKDFEFWGWGDIDVIYGQIRSFGVDNLLDLHDIISFKPNWISGCFCLIRNKEVTNRLFLRSRDVNKIYSDPLYKGFDEVSFCWKEARATPIDQINFPHDNFTRIVFHAASRGDVGVCYKNFLKESLPRMGYVVWDKGQIMDHERRPYLLYHYITEKRKPYFKYPKWNEIPLKFLIDERGFYTEDQFRMRKRIGLRRMLQSLPLLLANLFMDTARFLRNILWGHWHHKNTRLFIVCI